MDLSQDLSIDGSTSVSRTVRNYRFTRVIPNQLQFLAEISSMDGVPPDPGQKDAVMRFLTDDGLFGFIVTPLTGSGMYRFQLVIHGELVGDMEPCFLESAMRSLGSLHELVDSRFHRISVDARSVMDIIESDDSLHDAALLQVAESLDG